jgi:hypothetical protein
MDQAKLLQQIKTILEGGFEYDPKQTMPIVIDRHKKIIKGNLVALAFIAIKGVDELFRFLDANLKQETVLGAMNSKIDVLLAHREVASMSAFFLTIQTDRSLDKILSQLEAGTFLADAIVK